jgi:hypothetical protein
MMFQGPFLYDSPYAGHEEAFVLTESTTGGGNGPRWSCVDENAGNHGAKNLDLGLHTY